MSLKKTVANTGTCPVPQSAHKSNNQPKIYRFSLAAHIEPLVLTLRVIITIKHVNSPSMGSI